MSPLVGFPGPGDFCPGGLLIGGTFSPGVICPGALLAGGTLGWGGFVRVVFCPGDFFPGGLLPGGTFGQGWQVSAKGGLNRGLDRFKPRFRPV